MSIQYEQNPEFGPGNPDPLTHESWVKDYVARKGGGGVPAPHAASHEDGGTDEINVEGLLGVLALGQLAAALQTATGAVVIAAAAAPTAGQTLVAIDANSAEWASAPPPGLHAETHENGGGDEISVEGLSGLLATPQTPAAHGHAGADITSGTVAAARLGSGSGGSTKYLREDSTWQAVTQGQVSAPYATGSLDIKTGTYFIMSRHLQLAGSERVALGGTATLRIT